MAGHIASYAAKKALGKKMDKYKNNKVSNDDDPFFAYVTLPNGKQKKVRKQIPEYIPEHDAMILEKCKNRAYKLDVGLFSFAGIQFGWSSVIGLVPEIGDVFDMGFALHLVSMCNRVDGKLGTALLIKMLGIVFLDFLIGLVPFLGDLGDAVFKANTKNVALLERHLMKKYGGDTGLTTEELDTARYEDLNDEPKRTFDEKNSVGADTRPAEEPVHKSRKGSGGRRWYGADDRSRHDVEMGDKPNTRGKR